ncbi:MAG: TRAP transporter small permease subunit [Castellaniella sp.]|uniref:TRAP transporter small permease n=1 Tax=Castellaniella sp. TaxID=1955812 RepID=UPI0012207A83|nr:TRAP transporter small permease subunit [Castellaniella sp.]TAN30558.1 MAG: TRAP transporter small permease subunit [Castellaniella sp.]
MTEHSVQAPNSGSSRFGAVLRVTHGLGQGVGYVSAALMVIMTLSILLGIVMRATHVDNSWTYDVDLFALIWVAFVGASFTALREEHVTSGIALENAWPRCAGVMLVLRFVIMAAFLVTFTISGLLQFMNSVQTSETTLDVMSWPVWIPHLALPVGTSLWLVFEIHHFLRRVAAKRT